MDRKVFFALVNFGALVALLALVLYLLRPFLSSLAWAAVIALATYPMHRWFLKLTRGRVVVAAVFSTLVVILTVVVPLLVMAILFVGEAANVLAYLQQAAAQGHIPGRAEFLANPVVAHILEKVEPYLQGVDFKPILLAAMKTGSTLVVSLSKGLLVNTFAFIAKLFVMLAVLFFAFRDGAAISAALWDVVPLKPADKAILLSTVKRVVSAVMYGVVLTCVVQGILGGIGFAIAGLPSPVFFGALMILCAFIPLIGTALVWVPGVLYLAAAGHYGKAAFLAFWGVAVISSIDNFIRPFFISGKAKIPLLVILLGVLGGLASMGFLGVIVGPLVFALALDIVKVYRTEIFSRLKSDLGP
jgi:predicted PurR-regulated permease PerM